MTTRPPDLPEGAQWAGEPRNQMHRFRWVLRAKTPWWRYWGQTTVYAGRFHTAIVRCDSEAVADAVIQLHHPELTP